jgi:predicted RNA binding protein YcfA (HicA-like mRNA interferase family)
MGMTGARITPVSWGRLPRVFELDGYVFTRGKGSHWVGRKPGVIRPVVIRNMRRSLSTLYEAT